MRPLRFIAFVVTAVSALVACSALIGGIDQEVGLDRPDTRPPDDTCVHALPPAPNPDAVPGTDLLVKGLFFGAKTVRIRPPPNVPAPGYDLDGRCTGNDASTTKAPSCVTPRGTMDTDADGGVDNAFAIAAASLPFPDDYLAGVLNAEIATGILGLVVQLSHYNGTLDDPEINLGIISSGGVECLGSDCDNGGPASPHPRFDGTDVWTHFAASAVVDGLASPTMLGYVVGGTIVSRSDNELAFNLGDRKLTLFHPLITAKIVKLPAGKFQLDNVTITGIASLTDALRFAQQTVLPDDAGTVCSSPIYKSAALNLICSVRDSRTDFDASGPCDGVSYAFQFDAVQAADHLGGLVTARHLPDESCIPDTACPN